MQATRRDREEAELHAKRRNSSGPVAGESPTRSRTRTGVLVAVTALGVYLCYRLAIPFIAAIAWALALAILFTPFQCWLESKVRRQSLAAIITVVVIGTIVVVPASFVGQHLIQQSAKGAELLEAKVKSGEWRRALEARPRLAAFAETVEREMDLRGTLKAFATWLSNAAGSILKGSMFQVLGFCLTFYLLFFFLRDRAVALQSLRALSPLSKPETDRLFSRVADTVYATIYGTLAVSAAQGLLGGAMFWALGLSAPLLWGVVMALLAIVPVLGAFIVWVPAAVFLAVEGSWGKALILAVWGMVVVGTVDNVLRPVLVGTRLNLHTVLAFMSVVGGLMVFGSAGLVLGPVLLTITIVLLENWPGRSTQSALAATSAR